MKKLQYKLKHLKADVQMIHDNLEHVSTHSRVCNELVKELKRHRAGDQELREFLFQSMNNLDYGKHYIGVYHDWLRRELECDGLFSQLPHGMVAAVT